MKSKIIKINVSPTIEFRTSIASTHLEIKVRSVLAYRYTTLYTSTAFRNDRGPKFACQPHECILEALFAYYAFARYHNDQDTILCTCRSVLEAQSSHNT